MLFRISLDSVRVLESALFGDWLCVYESMEVDSVIVSDFESVLDCVLPTFALVDSVIAFESALDFVFVLESALDSLSSALLRFYPCPFFRISLDSVFLRFSFSRIFPRFSKSLVCAKEKEFIPSSHPLAPKR